ncbi:MULTISPECIES: zinc-dependent metalloprotease [unclassified Duganella]|uniref:zinc-dependent metalloprotease n=1 Tax=unclassified Duganella TaxID=2636909 RepID=UPI0008816E40|nr:MULTISPECIES: zinc-dependent metalloprotease [unclassified Duganella]SDG24243.1 protein of unknown function [Duganella sp. OV458]SDJ24123.1 protein of unknown function [Duganella sp. OV510]
MFVLNSLRAAVLAALSVNALAQEPTPPTPPVPPAPDVPVVATAPLQAPATPTPVPTLVLPTAAPRPFIDLVRGAAHLPGFLGLYRKDEKVWIELRPEQFDRPLFMSVNMPNGIGERGIYGSQMGLSQVVIFHRIGNLVQMIAKNVDFSAKGGTPQARVVQQAFSDSLLAVAPVVSGPHPQSKAILVEANALLLGDIPSMTTRLETAFRMPYAMDARNSSFMTIRADDNMTGLQVNAHFFVPRIAARPAVVPTVPLPIASPPTTLPDPRSMFLGFYYSFMPLPAQAMHSRRADDRIGHFVSTSQDFSDDVTPTTAVHLVERWRLEKKDPAAAVSEPVQPITYWIDANVPEKYRESVRQGVLAWNDAFERIGFRNAIVVKQQAATDTFDTMDARHASIRWFVGADVGFAIGPSQVDPRSGEILDADIGMSDVFARGARRMVGEDSFDLSPPPTGEARCDYMHESAQEMGFAMDVLEARGELEMGSPEADAVAQAYVKSVIMHEVGHTLGLRHNFRSSTIYTLKQLQDPAFTRKNGLAGSVMDYTPFNLSLKGEKQGEYVPSTLGPYDYWAIEYAYKPVDPAHEKEELAKIASRSSAQELAFGTDQDANGFNMDPDVNVFDLGSDPLSYFQRRLTISRELWDRVQTRTLKPGESYEVLRRSFDYGFQQFARTLPVVVKYIGGVTYLRDHAGTARATFTPVSLPRQREALQMLTSSLFKADSFQFSPETISRLGADNFTPRLRQDVSVGTRVLSLQAAALDQLMSDGVAVRLIDSQEKLADRKLALSLAELYGSVQQAVWSELTSGKDIGGMRRNLQREHLKRLVASLVRVSVPTLADVRSLQRENALQLQRDVRVAMGRPMSREAKAHLSETYESLTQALKASMLRAGA